MVNDTAESQHKIVEDGDNEVVVSTDEQFESDVETVDQSARKMEYHVVIQHVTSITETLKQFLNTFAVGGTAQCEAYPSHPDDGDGHCHISFQLANAKSFSAIHKAFKKAGYDQVRVKERWGTVRQLMDYSRKTSKKDVKTGEIVDEKVLDGPWEWGEIDYRESEREQPLWVRARALLRAGHSTYDLLNSDDGKLASFVFIHLRNMQFAERYIRSIRTRADRNPPVEDGEA